MEKLSSVQKEFLTTREMAELVSLTESGLKQIKAKHFVEGVHFSKLSPVSTGRVMWNRVVVLNWFATRHDPAAHERFCAEYLQSLEKYPKAS